MNCNECGNPSQDGHRMAVTPVLVLPGISVLLSGCEPIYAHLPPLAIFLHWFQGQKPGRARHGVCRDKKPCFAPFRSDFWDTSPSPPNVHSAVSRCPSGKTEGSQTASWAASPTPPNPRQDTGFIPTCCAASRSRGPIKSGPWTSHTFPWRAASSIWLRSSTGSAAVCWPGGCRSPWTLRSASKH